MSAMNMSASSATEAQHMAAARAESLGRPFDSPA